MRPRRGIASHQITIGSKGTSNSELVTKKIKHDQYPREKHIKQYDHHFLGRAIHPNRSNPRPSTAIGALGPAFVVKWSIDGFRSRKLVIPKLRKATLISPSGRTSLRPLNGEVIVSNFGSENFGDVARKNARTERSSLNLTSIILGNDPFLIPSFVSTHSNLTLFGKTCGKP